LTIAEGWEQWLKYIDSRGLYMKHGQPTTTRRNYRNAMAWVLRLYASLLANDFGPYNLNICRDEMDRSGLARRTINSYVGKIRIVWDWLARQGYVDGNTVVALGAVRSLHEREGGYETARILSVGLDRVEPILKRVSPPIRAMLSVCTWSGCRIGEAIVMRTCDLKDEHYAIPDQLKGRCWVYEPYRHKTEHRGTKRLILLGPQAISIIEPWLRPTDPEGYLFRPYESLVAFNKGRGKGKPSTWKSTATLDKARPYTYAAISRAITKACKELGVPHWHSHQLRHLAATRLAKQYGVEITQILLGHIDPKTTLQYIDPDVITKDDRERYAQAIRAIAEQG
jgi:integrase